MGKARPLQRRLRLSQVGAGAIHQSVLGLQAEAMFAYCSLKLLNQLSAPGAELSAQGAIVGSGHCGFVAAGD
jgi:hypothetical protein